MTNDTDATFQDLADAVQEIERLRASNEFKAEAIRQQAGGCLELMRELDELAAANRELFDELRRHVDGCGCKLEARFSSTAANALRAMLTPTVELLQQLANGPRCCYGTYSLYTKSLDTETVDKELSRLKSLMEWNV